MNILIIGGAGFIGSQTTKAIRIRYFPIVLDNLSHEINNNEDVFKVPLIIGEAGDKQLLKKYFGKSS